MKDTTISPLLASSGVMPGFLVIESGSMAGQRFPLPQAPGALLLGRERLCNVRFDPDRDRVVGRNHARIEVRTDGIFLVDLNSANGTFREDGSAVRGEVRLSPKDRFQLGGEGGPWLSLQMDAVTVAIHVAPPASEMPTLVTPAAAAVNPTTTAPPVAQQQIIAAPSPSLHPLPQRTLVENAPVTGLEPEPPRRIDRVPDDPVVRKQQTQYRRQLVAIALLLILACSLGLAIGLREPPVEDDVETVRSE